MSTQIAAAELRDGDQVDFGTGVVEIIGAWPVFGMPLMVFLTVDVDRVEVVHSRLPQILVDVESRGQVS